MLDLNLEAESTDSTYCDKTEPKVAAGDDSGTSNISSSVVNATAAEEEYSNSCSDSLPTLNFSILKNNSHVIEFEDESSTDREELVTRQLFPVAGESPTATSPQQLWLNLAVPERGGVESGIYQPQTQTQTQAQPAPAKKSRRGPRSRSSQFRGVTFYRRTGRWESHIWDCGKQVYLGGFDTAHAAARAYDQAAIKFRGDDADINFHISDYTEIMKQVKNLTKEEFIQVLRRQTSGFSRGSSKHRGVTLQKFGQWEARMGQLLGKKSCDVAAIRCNEREAVTNFEPSPCQGSGENLDLNLWVSPPTAAPENENPQNIHFQDSACELPNAKRLKVERSDAAPHSLRMASNYPPPWTTVYSGLALNNEERSKGTKSEAIPTPGISNWTWNVASHGVDIQVPPFSSAASSGFSSTTSYTTSLLPLTTQNMKMLVSGIRPFDQ